LPDDDTARAAGRIATTSAGGHSATAGHRWSRGTTCTDAATTLGGTAAGRSFTPEDSGCASGARNTARAGISGRAAEFTSGATQPGTARSAA